MSESIRSLPARPDLEQLKRQAKELLSHAQAGDLSRLRASHPEWRDGAPGRSPQLSDAQWAVAREYGFESWPKLKFEVERLNRTREENAAALVEACIASDAARVQALLAADPALAQFDFTCALLTHDAATVRAALARNPAMATTPVTKRNLPPLVAACRSVVVRTVDDPTAIPAMLVAAGASPNSAAPLDPPFEKGNGSALYWAAGFHGSLPLARYLLSAGANPDNPPDEESLYHCVEHDDAELTGLILSGCKSNRWVSYCILAQLDREFPAGVRLFVDAGADLSATHPSTGQTPLHWAVKRNRSREIVDLLLDAGAPAHARDRHGVTAYQIAVLCGHADAMASLEARGGAGEISKTGTLFRAAAQSDAAFAEVLASFGGQPVPFAPIHNASAVFIVQHGRYDMLRRLLSVGLSPNQMNESGHTALHWACLTGRPDGVRLLLDHNANGAAEDLEHHGVPAGWVAWASLFAREAPDERYVECVHVLGRAGCPMPPEPWGTPAVAEAIKQYGVA